MNELEDIKEFESLEIKGMGVVEPGIFVEHPSLGIGEVENIYQQISTGDVSLNIKFSEYGSKTISPKHAHLSVGVKPDPDSFVVGILKAAFKWW